MVAEVLDDEDVLLVEVVVVLLLLLFWRLPEAPCGRVFVILTVRVRKLPWVMPRGGVPTLLLVLSGEVLALLVTLAPVLVATLAELVVLLAGALVEEEEFPGALDPDDAFEATPISPRAKDDKAEATAAEAACARPPARLPFMGPIMVAGIEGETIVAGSMLFKASISEYKASMSSLGGVVVLDADAIPSSVVSLVVGLLSSTESVSIAFLSPPVSAVCCSEDVTGSFSGVDCTEEAVAPSLKLSR